jgi:proline iminopeptidase
LLHDPLFPDSLPRFARQMSVGEGHVLYVEECAAINGLPVLFLHGGPGSGCSPTQRRLFDPSRFHAVLFDQRGCGRSRPLGSIKDNTTAHLVADLEYLRDALGIPAWIVFGGSWGSLLGLAYAQLFPERVLGLVLRGVFLGSRDEINAYVQGSHGVVPEAWDTFSGSIPRTERSDLLAAYARRILGEDSEIARLAARAWLDYERALMGEMPLVQMPDAVQMAKARLQMHYLTHDCFLAPGQLLAGVERLRHIPAAIVQGLADPVCPPHVAESLHRAWPEATWVPVPDAGHGGLSPPVARACINALGWVGESIVG